MYRPINTPNQYPPNHFFTKPSPSHYPLFRPSHENKNKNKKVHNHRLPLSHTGKPNGPTGAASCLPATTHPSSPPTSRLQHDQRNPQAKASYSISVHASPCKSGSKLSQTACEGWTSRSPFFSNLVR